MNFFRVLILVVSILLLISGLWIYLKGSGGNTLDHEIRFLESESVKNPPKPASTRDCNKKIMDAFERINISEGDYVTGYQGDDEVILVAVAGDCLECEKRIGVIDSKITFKPQRETTIWVLVKPDSLERINALISKNGSIKSIQEKLIDEVTTGNIRTYPTDRILKLYGELNTNTLK